MKSMKMTKTLVSLLLVFMLALTACSQPGAQQAGGSSDQAADAQNSSDAPGTGGTAVGFIFVGTKDDYGYNQAAYLGSERARQNVTLALAMIRP